MQSQRKEAMDFQLKIAMEHADETLNEMMQEHFERKQRDNTITLRLSSDEREQLEKECREKNLSFSDFLRQKVLFEIKESEIDRRLSSLEDNVALLMSR